MSGVSRITPYRFQTVRGFPVRHPRESGGPGASAQQAVIKIEPLWICLLDELKFPGSAPFFDLLLSEDCGVHAVVKFEIDKSVHVVSCGKSFDNARLVQPNSASKIAGYPDIKRSIAIACKKVNTRLFRVAK